MLMVLLLPLCLPAYAIDEVDEIDDYSDPAIDIADEDASLYSHNFESNDPIFNSFINTEGVDVEDPLDAPQDNGGISTFALKETNEPTDVNFELEALTQAQLDADADGTRFKNIVNVIEPGVTAKNRTYLLEEVKAAYASYVPEKNVYLNMQGSCNDGEYVYYSFYVGNRYKVTNADGTSDTVTDPAGVCILAGKFNENDEFVTHNITYSTELLSENGTSIADELKHGNDITYNSLRDELIIVCCQKGYHNRIYKFDAAYFRGETDTAPRATKIDLSCLITGLAYNEKMNKYVGAVSGDIDQFVIFDSDFNIIAKYDGDDGESSEDKKYEGLARQCVACDDNYIYATYYVSGSAHVDAGGTAKTKCNVLGVFDWEGKKIREINLDIDRFYIQTHATEGDLYNVYEIEGITFIDGKVLLGFNCGYGKNKGARVANFYYYDFSNEFFSIKYCPDSTDVQSYIDNDDLKTQNILHGYTTKTYANTFTNSGKLFKGWYLYSVNSQKWRCYNSETNEYKWLSESQITDGFEKYIYPEHANVTQTASKGNQVLFCAAWEDAQNKFYVSFDPNKGATNDEDANIGKITGTMPQNVSMEYGGSNQLPKNSFEKEIEKYNGGDATVTLAFQGWNAYYVEGNKWYYKNSDGSHKAWYIEGEQPEGYVKCVYYNEATISKTTAPGRHIIMVALWNEFTIYYDSNGLLINKDSIKAPQVVVLKNSLNIQKYIVGDIDNTIVYSEYDRPVSFKGYNQYLSERNLWRYVDGDSSYWASPSENAELYCFTGNSVSQGVGYGQHVVFKAVWNY